MDFVKDLWGFLKVRKKFWLLPIILTLLVFRGLDDLCQRVGHRPLHLHHFLRG